ncbi:MAG: 5-hydroxyisourate hydrolase [Bradymonadia bacterium]|jgi:5-hydroxyisourate hydrolase
MKSPLTTHVLETATGRPAGDLQITLERQTGEGFSQLAEGVTNADGRITDLITPEAFGEGVYRITFQTGLWYAKRGERTFYPTASVVFEVFDASEHHHVPLLLNPFGYSTYRGS